MADRKYAAIQFTSSDFAAIKAMQETLNGKLGLKLSLAQTVIYCLEQLGKNDQTDTYAEAQANRTAYEEAVNYYKYKSENNDAPEIDGQLILRSVFAENQDLTIRGSVHDN